MTAKPITIFFDTGSPPAIIGWTDGTTHEPKDYLKGANKSGHTCRIAAVKPNGDVDLFVSEKGFDKYVDRNGNDFVETFKSDVYVISHADYLLSKMKG